ncbi:MAG: M48 family metalloprotease, partial [bacterium]
EMIKMRYIIVMLMSIFMLSVFAFCGEEEAPELKEIKEKTEKICLSMKPFLERPEKFKSFNIVKEDVINAYADTGGNIVFFTGMIDFLQSEDEVAMVCGHEMSHLSAQHIKRSLGTRILATIAGEAIGGTAGDVAGTLLFSKQSRKHERESDRRGLVYAWKAGYDPRVSWRLWEAMQEQAESGNAFLEKYLSTHPVHAERITNFKVQTYRICLENPNLKYCADILADEELKTAHENFK